MSESFPGPRWALRFFRAVTGVVIMITATGGEAATTSSAAPRAGEAEARILFIGNSLTASNDLPRLVEALARSAGIQLRCEAVTYANFSLEDHWNRGSQNRLRNGGFQYVVLQQGPSSLASSRANLRQWTARFSEAVRASGAIPTLYMVWPDQSRIAFFPQVAESYRLAAEDVEGVLLPAGEVWMAAWRRDPRLELYGADNFHPSTLGTYAAAATILSSLTGLSPANLPARLRLSNGVEYKVDAKKAAIVREAVTEVLAGAKPRPVDDGRGRSRDTQSAGVR